MEDPGNLSYFLSGAAPHREKIFGKQGGTAVQGCPQSGHDRVDIGRVDDPEFPRRHD
ncbi:MAG: hypothetical protein ACJAS7_000706 [Alpinimonas sp.]|jgi:hypothetical protein